MAIVRTKNMKRRKTLLLPLIKKKQNSSNSIEEITKASFNAALLKSSADNNRNRNRNDDGGVSKPSSSWVKSHFLGKGSYGSVYLATSKSGEDKRTVAIKSAEFSRASSLMHERIILSRLDSVFIVRCYGDEVEKSLLGSGMNYNLILEYCSGQSIADLMKTNGGGGLSEKDVKVFARDILCGLHHIHSQRFIHCDIKPHNILLSRVDNRIRHTGYLTKIADFGLAMRKGSFGYGNGRGHKRGTTRYMAPELITHGIVDYGVDTWAFGCTVLEMLTGQVAWGEHGGDLGSEDLMHLIGSTDFIPYIPDWLSEEAQNFLSKCFVKDSRWRWSIGALIDHHFLNMD